MQCTSNGSAAPALEIGLGLGPLLIEEFWSDAKFGVQKSPVKLDTFGKLGANENISEKPMSLTK